MRVMDADFAQEFVRMADDAWKLGWHEANGGNLSYRLHEDEVSQIADSFEDGDWKPIGEGVAVPGIAGETFMVTASGSHFRNMARFPKRCAGIIQIDDVGERFRQVWGFEGAGRPTCELPSHMLLHEAKKAATGGESRVVYHAHPANTIALTHVLPQSGDVLTRELWRALTECEIVFPEGVGVLLRMTPGTVELGRATVSLIENHDAVLWAEHGIICAGVSFDSAFGLVHTIEKASEILLKTRN